MTGQIDAYKTGATICHSRFGIGRVELDNGKTVIARFDLGIEECLKSELELVSGFQQALRDPVWQSPRAVLLRFQAEVITSINDAWGVFSRSAIALLPHQLWVCKKVNETWPARWLVADDVGLGKTIEAGLILWPLISKGIVERFLIIAPASLVPQWQERLRRMFDIRVAVYSPEQDKPPLDFWSSHNQVVASLHTLRTDSSGRHERFFEYQWDLVIVDEAHHLNADEQSGPTLGYRLLQRLNDERRVQSFVFFTGTPHRGKTYGFISLLRLLRPDWFDPRVSLASQMSRLPHVMIRNNKQCVTNLRGERLFQPPKVTPETYQYSDEEAHFYDMLTRFISTGEAYASSLGPGREGQAVMLVLIAMQKLASSSIAAIRRALARRLERISRGSDEIERVRRALEEAMENFDADTISVLEEQIAELSAALQLMQDEEPRLRALLTAANRVRHETKIEVVIEAVKSRFAGRQVLFFTEYKATQSLLISALMQEFGPDCVTFINGDDRAEGVNHPIQGNVSLDETRLSAADRFNRGDVRFLVSTEAGGEGIDLQENCWTLIHIDLPWNPMRLHQRVGRLNRYGQTRRVEVLAIHNPLTVESRIWELLEEKIQNVTVAYSRVMADPEDVRELILGITSPQFFQDLYWNARRTPPESLSDWFDRETATFAGRDAMLTIKDIVGHAERFDYDQVSSHLPQLDLPDLEPFFVSAIRSFGRSVTIDNGQISFLTPDAWRSNPRLSAKYDGMIFGRRASSQQERQRILGIGHPLVDEALRIAKAQKAFVATLSHEIFQGGLIVFRVFDRVTSDRGTVRSTVVGVEVDIGNADLRLLTDAQMLSKMNGITEKLGRWRYEESTVADDINNIETMIERAKSRVAAAIPSLGLPYQVPEVETLGVLWSHLPHQDPRVDPAN